MMKSEILGLFEPQRTLPVMPLVGTHAAGVAHIEVNKTLTNGHFMAEAALKALKYYGYDGVLTFMDLTLEAEALGCEVRYHPGTVPSVKKVLLENIDDYDHIKNSKLEEGKRVAEFLRAARIMRENIGSGVVLGALVTGPFTLAGQLLGMESLFENMILKADATHEVLERTADIAVAMTGKFFEEGVNMVIVLDPMASSDLISPLHFDLFAKPYLKRVVKAHGDKTFLVLHICGNTTEILAKMLECGYDGFSIDSKVDIGYAAHLLGNKAVLMGNVDPVGVLLNGTPEDVRKASASCIESSSESEYFIFSSGCEVPENTPEKNIKEMVRVAGESDLRKSRFKT